MAPYLSLTEEETEGLREKVEDRKDRYRESGRQRERDRGKAGEKNERKAWAKREGIREKVNK